MTDLVALKAANAARWGAAKLTRNFSGVAQHLIAGPAKARYLAVSRATGVPWWFVAVVHEREASLPVRSTAHGIADLTRLNGWLNCSFRLNGGRKIVRADDPE